jgi:hypothetical protein
MKESDFRVRNIKSKKKVRMKETWDGEKKDRESVARQREK